MISEKENRMIGVLILVVAIATFAATIIIPKPEVGELRPAFVMMSILVVGYIFANFMKGIFDIMDEDEAREKAAEKRGE